MKALKKFAALIICTILLVPVYAVGNNKTAVLKIGVAQMAVDSQVQAVDDANPSVAPIAENSRTLVPVSRIVAAFGGNSGWDPATNDVWFSLNGHMVTNRIGESGITIDGVPSSMDVPSQALNNRTYVPLRFVLEGLGLVVDYEPAEQLVVVSQRPLSGSLLSLPQAQALLAALTPPPAPAAEPISLVTQSYSLPSGNVSANVVTVDMSSPRVSVQAALPQGKLNTTQRFADICAASGADVVINANFFESYQEIKDPIGHVMSNGKFIYADSGCPSFAFTSGNQVRYGFPGVFFRIKTVDGGKQQEWAAFSMNNYGINAIDAVLYTPARGDSFPVPEPGVILTVNGDVITGYRRVMTDETVAIPADGYVLYMNTAQTTTGWFQVPEIGRRVAVEPYLFGNNNGFILDGVVNIVSGGPCLVENGAVCPGIKPDVFATDARFTSNAAPRTAMGLTADNKLLLVNTSRATIQQMKELMLQLGCVNAINLDGGASTAMYYKGKVISNPGRELTTTFQVFVR